MRPKERRETGQSDLFRARLDQIVDLAHPVVKLARAIDWGFLEEQFGAVYTDEPGRPPNRCCSRQRPRRQRFYTFEFIAWARGLTHAMPRTAWSGPDGGSRWQV